MTKKEGKPMTEETGSIHKNMIKFPWIALSTSSDAVVSEHNTFICPQTISLIKLPLSDDLDNIFRLTVFINSLIRTWYQAKAWMNDSSFFSLYANMLPSSLLSGGSGTYVDKSQSTSIQLILVQWRQVKKFDVSIWPKEAIIHAFLRTETRVKVTTE